MAALTRLQGLYLQSNELTGLSALREGVLRHMPLQNLGLGTNRFDLAEGFELPCAACEANFELAGSQTSPHPLPTSLAPFFSRLLSRALTAAPRERGGAHSPRVGH